MAPLTCAASHSPWLNGTIRSSLPCQIETGTLIASRVNPQPVTKARSSSHHPSTPPESPTRNCSAKWSARSPSSVSTSTGGSREVSSEAICSPVTAASAGRHRSRKAVTSASPPSAAPNSSTLSSPMPAIQSSPSASCGATPAMTSAARTRSGSSAAHASACGPPPDQPATRQSSTARVSRTAAVSVATDATVRPCRRLEPAYPGRDHVTSRRPRSAAACCRCGSWR